MNCIEKILDLIDRKGITKNKMLADLKLSKNSFVNWIERDTVPSGETLAKIAGYFGVSTDYLLGAEQKNNSLSELDSELNMLCKAMTEEDKIKMLEHAELLIAARNLRK